MQVKSQLRINGRKYVVVDAFASRDNGRRISTLANFVEGLCGLHQCAEETEGIMFHMPGVQDLEHKVDPFSFFARVWNTHSVHSILLNDPQDWSQQLVHTLPVTDIGIQFRVDE